MTEERVSPSWGDPTQGPYSTHVAAVQDLAGAAGPSCALSLVAAASSPKLLATQLWCVANPDALATLGVSAGATVLVGVTDQSTAGSASAAAGRARPPATPTTPPSFFAPVSLPSLHAPDTRLLSLHHLLLRSAGSIRLQPRTSSGQITAAGHFLVPALLWPSSRLPRGKACASPALLEHLGRPTPDTVLALLTWSTGSALRAPGQTLHCTPPQCSKAVLRACYDTAACRVASLGPAESTARPGSETATGGNTPATGTRPTSANTPTATPPSARRNAAASPGPATPRRPSPAPAGDAAAEYKPPGLGDWVLALLQPGPGIRNPPPSATSLTPTQRQLLSSLVAGRVRECALLAGALLPFPLLGHTLLLEVLQLVSPSGQDLAAGMVAPGRTAVELLLPGEEPEPGPGPTAAPDAQASAGGADGRRRSLKADIAAARRAAEEAVGDDGAAQAAADAAERAVLAGWHAAGLDFQALGGISHLVPSLRQLVTLPLQAPDLLRSLRVVPPRGVLLHGPPGSGKTVLARATAGDAGAALLVLNGPDVMSEFLGESEAGLRGVFAAARALAPTVVFIDEIDAIAPARSGAGAGDAGVGGALSGGSGGGGSETAARVVTTLLTCLDGAGGSGPGDGVVVIGATNRRDALDPAMRRPGRLDRELEVGPPPPAARLEILENRLRGVRHSLSPDQLRALADAAHGFVAADLMALVNEAGMAALRRAVAAAADAKPLDMAALHVTWADVVAARARVRPSALREIAVEVPEVHWDDIGGLQDVKQRLQEVVVWPFQAPDAFTRFGAVPPRGVLLYGPPGCSKTMLARAVAAEAKLNFLSIKGGELFSKYVGESEKAVAALFARARSTAPCIVFFDEIDALASARSADGAGGGLADRVMSQLLTEMDGLQGRQEVLVLAATNRPDRLDPALLRPGRFDRLVHIPLPDEAARAEILKVQLRRTPLAPDVDVCQLSQGCSGFSGADLGALVREAALAALDEDINAQQVYARHFQAARGRVAPSAVTSADVECMYKEFSSAGLPSDGLQLAHVGADGMQAA